MRSSEYTRSRARLDDLNWNFTNHTGGNTSAGGLHNVKPPLKPARCECLLKPLYVSNHYRRDIRIRHSRRQPRIFTNLGKNIGREIDVRGWHYLVDQLAHPLLVRGI